MSDITVQPGASALRILIPGGPGHLGQFLARYFSALGQTVITLTPRPAQCNSGVTWKQLSWDGRTLGPWTDAPEHTDVLINLAGRSVDCRYNTRNRAEILHSRADSTIVLGHAIQAARRPPRLWLNASTATIYRHTFDRAMDEHSGDFGGNEPDVPVSWRFRIDVARQWEQPSFPPIRPPRAKSLFAPPWS